MGSPLPAHLIDIKKLRELNGIRNSGAEITIGALTLVETLRKSEILKLHFTSLSQASEQFAGVQIRHRATVGGNICNASPAGDLLPGLYAAHATVSVLSSTGIRRQSIEEFITGPGRTTLLPGELLTSIHLPKTGRKSKFYKLGLRHAMAISVVNLAISWEVSPAGAGAFLIAAGSVAPTVVYLRRFSDSLTSAADKIEALLSLVDQDICPITDIRASAEYRRQVLKNILRHEIRTIFEPADV